jgi:hypothetical protein
MFADISLLGFTISTVWAVILLIIWLAFAFWPARVAARKGHSFLGFFILSLFLFVIALIIAYMIPAKTAAAAPPPPAE